jgi:hypothetical protein
MRALTEDEVKLIAGGAGTNSTITVTAPTGTPITITAPPTGSSGFSSGTSFSGMGGGGGSSGGGSTPPEGVDPNHNYDAERDQVAQSVKDQINHMSDKDTKEHEAILYVGADGKVHSSPIFTGNEQKVDPQKILDWMSQNNVDMHSVVGFIHNHDAYYYGTSTEAAEVNRYPSVGDWGTADYFSSHGAGAGTSGFAMYLVDTDHALRQFDYNDNGLYRHLTDDQKERGVNLPGSM